MKEIRIIIAGPVASGKTTIAKKLAEVFPDYPIYSTNVDFEPYLELEVPAQPPKTTNSHAPVRVLTSHL